MKVSITPSVAFALRTLGDDDRRQVTAWIDHLKNWENDEYIRTHSRLLPTNDNVYVLRTGPDFRVFFTIQNGGIDVLDIVRKETLQAFK